MIDLIIVRILQAIEIASACWMLIGLPITLAMSS